jgi:hypothetical protein
VAECRVLVESGEVARTRSLTVIRPLWVPIHGREDIWNLGLLNAALLTPRPRSDLLEMANFRAKCTPYHSGVPFMSTYPSATTNPMRIAVQG